MRNVNQTFLLPSGVSLPFRSDESLRTAFHYEGAAFLNSINTDRVFVFCLSTKLDNSLSAEFDADVCVEILNTREFMERCERKVLKQKRFSESNLSARLETVGLFTG